MIYFSALMAIYTSYILSGCVVIFILRLAVPGDRAQSFLARTAKVAWLHLTKAILHRYFPGRVFIRYDPRILDSGRNIVISNHLTEYDWLFVSSVLHVLRRFEDICIILKMSLRDIPLLGYGMAFFQFIFLNRKISKDIELIKSGVSRLRSKGKYDLLIFPEGTYIDKDSHPKSQRWSRKAKVRVQGRRFNPKEVIIPRTTGFRILMENMKDHIDGIVGITMVGNPHVRYPNDMFPYWDVIVNRSCKVNFMFFLDYVPGDGGKSPDEFLLEAFERKEQMISRYKDIRGAEAVETMAEFQAVADKLTGAGTEYIDTAIDLTTPWGPLVHVFFVLGFILIIWSVVRLFSK